MIVKKLDNMDETLYACERCGLSFRDEEWAAKCEAWCTEHEGT